MYKFEWNEELHKKWGIVYEAIAEYCKLYPENVPDCVEWDDGIILEHYMCDDGPFDENGNPTDIEMLITDIQYVMDAWWEEIEEQEYLTYPVYKITRTEKNALGDDNIVGAYIEHFKTEDDCKEYIERNKSNYFSLSYERIEG